MFDLASAKGKLGIAVVDTTKDIYINLSLDTALVIAERYCDRLFGYATETARFLDFYAAKIPLKRYPLEQVTSVKVLDNSGRTPLGGVGVNGNEYMVHHAGGYVELYTPRYYKAVEVSYTGGYKVLPPDLELALWGIFDVVYAAMSAPPGSGGVTTQAGTIASITVPDVGNVAFAQGAGATAAQAKVTLAGSAAYGQYGTFFHLLDPYRSLQC